MRVNRLTNISCMGDAARTEIRVEETSIPKQEARDD